MPQLPSGHVQLGHRHTAAELVKRLNPEIGAQRLVNLVTAWDHEIKR